MLMMGKFNDFQVEVPNTSGSLRQEFPPICLTLETTGSGPLSHFSIVTHIGQLVNPSPLS